VTTPNQPGEFLRAWGSRLRPADVEEERAHRHALADHVARRAVRKPARAPA
jgi:hypothetical protein